MYSLSLSPSVSLSLIHSLIAILYYFQILFSFTRPLYMVPLSVPPSLNSSISLYFSFNLSLSLSSPLHSSISLYLTFNRSRFYVFPLSCGPFLFLTNTSSFPPPLSLSLSPCLSHSFVHIFYYIGIPFSFLFQWSLSPPLSPLSLSISPSPSLSLSLSLSRSLNRSLRSLTLFLWSLIILNASTLNPFHAFLLGVMLSTVVLPVFLL